MSSRLAALFAATSTFALLAAGSAQAQQAGQDVVLDELSVQGQGQGQGERARGPVVGYVAKRADSGTKTDTALVETAQSITVIPRDQIVQQDAHSLDEALRYTAGVTPESRGGVATRFDLFKVRGFDAANYLNGLRLQKNGSFVSPQVDPYLLERIEVLKGASSVLYGQAPTGGIVNMISKMPSFTPYREAGIRFGNYGYREGYFDLGGPIDSDDTFAYRVAGIGKMSDGQIDDTHAKRLAIAPSLTWAPSTDTSLTLTGIYQRDPEANGFAGVPASGSVLFNRRGAIRRGFNAGEPALETFNREEGSLGYSFRHDFSDAVTLRMNGQWFTTGLEYFGVFGSSLGADGRTLARSASQSHEHLDTFTFDNQVETRFTTGPLSHTLLAGLDAQAGTGSYWTGTRSAGVPSIDIFAPVYGRPVPLPTLSRVGQDTQQIGVYAQDQIRFGGFVATVAGRQDWAQSRTVNTAGIQKQDDAAFTSRYSLLYLFDNGIAPYAAYAQSFTPLAGADINGNAFKPETGEQYEGGVKYQPPGTDILLSAAYFDLTRNNLLTVNPVNTRFSVQVGQARSQGVELEGRMRLVDGFSLIAAYTHLDTRFTRDNSGLQGKVPTGVPAETASLWLYYEAPQSSTFWGLSLGGGVRYLGSTYNSLNSIKVPDVALADAALSYDFGKGFPGVENVRATFNIKNMFDTTYVGACYTSTTCAFGYGRTYTAGLTYRW